MCENPDVSFAASNFQNKQCAILIKFRGNFVFFLTWYSCPLLLFRGVCVCNGIPLFSVQAVIVTFFFDRKYLLV